MPVKPETRFYRRVNNRLPPEIHYQKIGSASENGTADIWYSGYRSDAWVEYKWEPKLSRGGVDPLKLLRPLQSLWINRRYREGRQVLVIIGTPEGCAILENGAWNARVPVEVFRHSMSDVSAFLSEKLHDASAVLEQGGSGHQSDISNFNDSSPDHGNSV